MVPAEILARLVPLEGPAVEFGLPRQLREMSQENPARRIGWWAAFVRAALGDALREDAGLREVFESSGFVGVGIFRSIDRVPPAAPPGFPIVAGYQFGVVFLTGRARSKEANRGTLKLGKSGFQIPAVEYSAAITNHASSWSQGFTAATFEENSKGYGVTARHVVDRYHPGQHVPVECSVCAASAKLERTAPGLLDAAVVWFPCGCHMRKPPASPAVRHAVEGETVDVHFGSSGRRAATVMMALSTPSQILSAATPMHFLVDEAGKFGDSGSLVSGETTGAGPWDLIGVYLGDCMCDDGSGLMARYGYALDMDQTARIFGVGGFKGEYK